MKKAPPDYIGFKISTATKNTLAKTAKKWGVPLSELMRQIVDSWVDARQGQKNANH